MLSRRNFVSAVFCAPLLAWIPYNQPEKKVGRHAVDYLSRAYNMFAKIHKRSPNIVWVSERLFDDFGSGLPCCMRFNDPNTLKQGIPSLKLKLATVMPSPLLKDWEYTIA